MTKLLAVPQDVWDNIHAELATLRTRIGVLEGRVASGDANRLITPKEVARRFRVAERLVYADLRSGRLVGEQRVVAGGITWRITPAAALTWWETHVVHHQTTAAS